VAPACPRCVGDDRSRWLFPSTTLVHGRGLSDRKGCPVGVLGPALTLRLTLTAPEHRRVLQATPPLADTVGRSAACRACFPPAVLAPVRGLLVPVKDADTFSQAPPISRRNPLSGSSPEGSRCGHPTQFLCTSDTRLHQFGSAVDAHPLACRTNYPYPTTPQGWKVRSVPSGFPKAIGIAAGPLQPCRVCRPGHRVPRCSLLFAASTGPGRAGAIPADCAVTYSLAAALRPVRGERLTNLPREVGQTRMASGRCDHHRMFHDRLCPSFGGATIPPCSHGALTGFPVQTGWLCDRRTGRACEVGSFQDG
jgi:hypothetical protein